MFFLLLMSSAFVACTVSQPSSLTEQNQNPLTLSRYSDEKADRLANLIITEASGALKEPLHSQILRAIDDAKSDGETARMRERSGMMGAFLSMEENVTGYALLEKKQLFFSSDFTSAPGLDVHVYLSQTLDPREGEFPDVTSIDLGPVQSFYGAQVYNVSLPVRFDYYRTLALYDPTLKRLFGFAQLSTRAQ